MRIVVTGAAGFIGSHLCEALLAAGHEVVGLDGFVPSYARSTKESNLAGAAGHPRFRLVEADLRTAELEPVLDGADVVVNLAAMPGLPGSWSNFDLYTSCNLLAVERLATASRRAGIARLVHASTSSVYGAEAVGDERMPCRPVSPYGVTKLAAEQLLGAHAAVFGLPVVVLRYFSVYGPRQRPDMAYYGFIEQLRRGRPIAIFGDGLQTRSITFVGDCVAGTMAAVASAAVGQSYNLGGGRAITLLDAVAILGEELHVSPEMKFRPARPGDQRHTRADTSLAARELGYRALVEPAEGIRRQVAWHLEHVPVGPDSGR